MQCHCIPMSELLGSKWVQTPGFTWVENVTECNIAIIDTINTVPSTACQACCKARQLACLAFWFYGRIATAGCKLHFLVTSYTQHYTPHKVHQLLSATANPSWPVHHPSYRSSHKLQHDPHPQHTSDGNYELMVPPSPMLFETAKQYSCCCLMQTQQQSAMFPTLNGFQFSIAVQAVAHVSS